MANWLTTAIQTMRDKSVDALDFVRKDLTEFTTTVKSDTETYLNKIKTQEVGDLGINRFVSKFSGADKSEDGSGKHIQASASFDRIKTELARLQNDESTYLTDPTPIEAYESWRQATDFNVEAHKGEIAQLLIDAPHVRSFYAHLVPAETTHADFWCRYYFRIHQIEEEEARRTQLIRRAHEICSETNDNTEENNANDWDEPDDVVLEEPTKVTEESVTETAPIEQQDVTPSETPLEQSNTERTGSETVPGDSWEREFDETDLTTSVKPDPSTQSIETVTSEDLSSSSSAPAPAPTPTPSSSERKKGNEFEDEWEAWA